MKPDELPNLIELAPQLSIANAADLHHTLLEHLKVGTAMLIDASRVELIDTAILQLLVSFWRTCLQRGLACHWRGVSDNLRQSAALIGVADLLLFPSG